MLGPQRSLPVSLEFETAEDYVDSLLDFVASSELLMSLCGGVHLLDFFTRTPDLYSLVLPQEWRSFFKAHDIMDILDLCMREDLEPFGKGDAPFWRDGPLPPEDLLRYIRDIRRFSMNREVVSDQKNGPKVKPPNLAINVAVGMNVKKVHEVSEFAQYVEKLTTDVAQARQQSITHLVDFGSGQNYLGRALASEPYNKHMIAVESRPHNIEGARSWDVRANLAPKKMVLRNKKQFRTQPKDQAEDEQSQGDSSSGKDVKGGRGYFAQTQIPPELTDRATLQISAQGVGSIQYVEHYIKDGDLSRVVDQIVDQDALRDKVTEDLADADKGAAGHFVEGNLAIKDELKATDPRLMVISLHSCGNLVHHGIRSLLMNPAVSVIALIGCCYNLITERLGPPTLKIPGLRTNHPRLEKTTNSNDPHGFPMSERLCNYEATTGKGLRLNITARMMAVQAPYNWGRKDSDGFFTRHFYRALLQRMFLDYGIVEAPQKEHVEANDGSPLGWSGETAPIILGSLRKSCYSSFVAYVRGALDKLFQGEQGPLFQQKMGHVTDEEIERYEEEYRERKKELSIIWSLMAFSANVIEAVIVSDRWLYLKEQDEVAQAWVEPIFDYALSPRNLVVVGIKR